MSIQMKFTVVGLAVLLALCGCQKREADTIGTAPESTPPTESSTPPPATDDSVPPPGGDRAVAELKPTQGNKASGTVKFASTPEGVRIALDVTGLTPGPHGFHVHENGDCSAPDASSAGGHFNPTGMPHGAPDAERRHAGDFGNLQADASGNAHAEFVDKHLGLQGESSVIGRAAVVHEKPDDLTTQPSGNSGARIACGVIQTASAQP